MKTRNARKTINEVNARQFEEAMAAYARAEHREAELTESINIGVNELVAGYQQELDSVKQLKITAFETVHAYCLCNKDTLFRKRRSIGTLHGIAGFRLGTPRLKLEKERGWNNILALLKDKLPAYVRTTEEPARHMLLADRHKEQVAPLLVEMGIQVIQDELFYIEAATAA